MTLETNFNTAVNADTVTLFTAVQIVLPGQTINLIDTAGFVTFAVDGVETTFTGSDPVFGTLMSVGAVGSQMGNETPRSVVVLQPPTVEAIGEIANVATQGSVVRAWEGAVDQSTGLVVGTPHLFWTGLIDVPAAVTDATTRMVEIDTVSVLARFLQKNEGIRLNLAWQHQHFGTASGLAFNVAATETPKWGAEGVFGTGFGGSVGGGGGTGGTTGGGGFAGGGGGFDLDRYIRSLLV